MSCLPPYDPANPLPRFIGLDRHKKEIQMVVLDHDGTQILARRFPSTYDNLAALADELQPTDTVAFEVGTNAVAVA